MGYLIHKATSKQSGFEYQRSIFFRALQSGQWDSVEEAHNDIDGLIEAVQAAFVFLTNQIKLFFLNITGLLGRDYFG